MCWKQFAIGGCCHEPFEVDWILVEDDEDSFWRYVLTTTGDIETWESELAGGSADTGGGAYAPSFDGKGVALGTGGGVAGVYEFDIETGADNGLLVSTSVTAGEGLVWQECAGYVTFSPDAFVGLLKTVDTSGTLATPAGSFTNTRTALRRPNGDIWRTLTTGGKKIWGPGTTERADLTSVAVESQDIVAIVSDDGDDIYALGYKSDHTKAEVFHIEGSTGTPTLLATTDASGGTDSGFGFTLIDGFIFWKMTGKIFRFNIATNGIDLILQKTSGDWIRFLNRFGQGFFVPKL